MPDSVREAGIERNIGFARKGAGEAGRIVRRVLDVHDQRDDIIARGICFR
jgi:hypothetical protein